MRANIDPELEIADLEQHRRALTGHCYRILGSAFDADDAVQLTMVRAWRSIDSFEGRSSVRSWLYRIATNVCLDELRGRTRRPEPQAEPVPDGGAISAESDPAEVAASRDDVRLAFVAALQRLPARQRAVLILREVLGWPAADVADLLQTTTASVNSALQRARATLGQEAAVSPAGLDADQHALLSRFVGAFERYDVSSLVSLLQAPIAAAPRRFCGDLVTAGGNRA